MSGHREPFTDTETEEQNAPAGPFHSYSLALYYQHIHLCTVMQKMPWSL